GGLAAASPERAMWASGPTYPLRSDQVGKVVELQVDGPASGPVWRWQVAGRMFSLPPGLYSFSKARIWSMRMTTDSLSWERSATISSLVRRGPLRGGSSLR